MRIRGKRVAVSGRLSTMTSGMAKVALERAGAIVASRVSKTTDLLVGGMGRTAQHARAEALGIPIIDEGQLQTLLDHAEEEVGAAMGADEISAGVAKIRACVQWDDPANASKHARKRAWRAHQAEHLAAHRAIEELGASGQHDILAQLLDHPVDHIRADVCAALLGRSHGNPTYRGPAANAQLRERVAMLLQESPSQTDYWAAEAWFSLDHQTAIDVLMSHLRKDGLGAERGEDRMCEIVRATPPTLHPELAARWHEHMAACLVWAPYRLRDAILRHLFAVAPELAAGALATPLSDDTFDLIMLWMRDVDDADKPGWLRAASVADGVGSERARRLRVTAEGNLDRRPAPTMSLLGQAGADGGPMILVSADHAANWEGVNEPSNNRVVDTLQRWDSKDAVATDYDLACDLTVPTGSALLAVGDGTALVTPQSWAGVAEVTGLDGFVVVVDGEDELCARYALSDSGWRPLGKLSVGQATLRLFSAAWPGRQWREAGGAEIAVAPGTYEVEELLFCDERGSLHLVRARRIADHA